VGVFSSFKSGFGRLVVLQSVEVFEKKEPRCLLRVVEFAGATGVFPEDIVDVFEGLLEHGWLKSDNSEVSRGSRAKKTKSPLSQIRLNEGVAVWHGIRVRLKNPAATGFYLSIAISGSRPRNYPHRPTLSRVRCIALLCPGSFGPHSHFILDFPVHRRLEDGVIF
jgi:hypothetical protein